MIPHTSYELYILGTYKCIYTIHTQHNNFAFLESHICVQKRLHMRIYNPHTSAYAKSPWNLYACTHVYHLDVVEKYISANEAVIVMLGCF